MPLFFAGSGESADTIICALEIPDDDWFKRALVEALTLMCDQNNWGERGTATADFARDKSCEMNETLEFDVFIPTIPIGTVMMHAGVTVPSLWKRCEGNSLLRSAFPDLFTAIGTIYGSVDGTHFNLPDFRDRSAIGWNAAASNQGTPAGAMTHAISVAELPAHNHVQQIANNVTMKAFVAGGSGVSTPQGIATSSANNMVTQNAGSGTAISILHPVLPMQFIIYAGV